MTPRKRFLHGGGGALMPVVVSLLAIDISAVFSDESNLTGANIAGIGIRYAILFLIGGVVAYLHTDENKPFKLFELGIAAPALITSIVAAQGLQNNQFNDPAVGFFDGISIISQAYATENEPSTKIVVAGGIFEDILRGASGSIYRDPTRAAAEQAKAQVAAEQAQARVTAEQAQARVTAEQAQAQVVAETKTRADAEAKIKALEAEIFRLKKLFP